MGGYIPRSAQRYRDFSFSSSWLEKLCWKHKGASMGNGILTLVLPVLSVPLLRKLMLCDILGVLF